MMRHPAANPQVYVNTTNDQQINLVHHPHVFVSAGFVNHVASSKKPQGCFQPPSDSQKRCQKPCTWDIMASMATSCLKAECRQGRHILSIKEHDGKAE